MVDTALCVSSWASRSPCVCFWPWEGGWFLPFTLIQFHYLENECKVNWAEDCYS